MPGSKCRCGRNTCKGQKLCRADEAIAHAVMSQLLTDEGLTTIELKSNFLAGVTSGDLTATATVFKKGRSLIIGDCLVTDSNDRNVCRVSATFMLLMEK
jgi:uncharacterized protein (TIGR00369 family)